MELETYIQSIKHLPLKQVNLQIEQICGITDFFDDISDIHCAFTSTRRDNKDEYGDWQTNAVLANKIAQQISESFKPQVILEPTCGKGSFVLAALETFDTIDDVFAIEIYKPYIQSLKYDILQRYLDGRLTKKIRFHLLHCNVFDVNWSDIKKQIGNKNLLVIGNPPWVTNSDLSKADSANLPKKSNFKQVKGLAAITGKGNFDIAEYISYELFKNFAFGNNHFALLLKNSVIKQICHSQNKMRLPVSGLRQYRIDAKKEFGASVEASLLTCETGPVSRICDVYDFYSKEHISQYGWADNKFVADLEAYQRTAKIDGVSPLEWWSGIKHDCQPVVELTKCADGYRNKLGELVDIEDTCIYPYVKSSDIKGITPTELNRYVIVTQHRINDNTEQLKYSAPKTYEYLMRHRAYFEQRKSSIYKNRPPFSMFGIGDYTFKPYKIVVSSLYKEPRFTLFTPIEGKCIVPDDTCYQIGFDKLEDAQLVLQILSTMLVADFIKSISFSDAKRTITKDLLMRINLIRAFKDKNMHDDEEHNGYQSIMSKSLFVEPLLFV